MAEVVSCENCGGALPPSASESPFVVCAFCGATTHVADSALVASKMDVAGVPEDAMDRYNWSRKQLSELSAQLSKPVTYAALSAALRDMLAAHIEAGAAIGRGREDVDQLLRIGYNLGRDFTGETGLELDGMAHSRLVEGALKANQALRTEPVFELNLPFIGADSSGPKHLLRKLDVGAVAALAARQPADPAPRAASPAAQPQPAEQPKGFWKKLFG